MCGHVFCEQEYISEGQTAGGDGGGGNSCRRIQLLHSLTHFHTIEDFNKQNYT